MSLEMPTLRPKGRAASGAPLSLDVSPQNPRMAHALSLRPATEADVPRLLDLWQEAMSPHFSVAIIPASNENPLHPILMRLECAEVISLEGSPIGLLKVARDSKEWKLVQILLSPSAQRRGIGTRLISSLIAEAQTYGSSLSLSVLRKNPALDLYLWLGFVIVEEEEHAINMHLGTNPAAQGSSTLGITRADSPCP